MDFSSLMLSLLFGSIGMGFLMYGKNAGQLVPIGAGLALMLCPYFIPNTIILLIVCCLLMAVPFVVKT
jgi:hypothetical protein